MSKSVKIFHCIFSRGHATLHLTVLVGRPVNMSVTFLNFERFSHYCSCPIVHDLIAVYPAFWHITFRQPRIFLCSKFCPCLWKCYILALSLSNICPLNAILLLILIIFPVRLIMWEVLCKTFIIRKFLGKKSSNLQWMLVMCDGLNLRSEYSKSWGLHDTERTAFFFRRV